MKRGLLAGVAVLLIPFTGSSQADNRPVLPGIAHYWAAEGNTVDSHGTADGVAVGPLSYASGVFSGQAFSMASGGWVEIPAEAGNVGTSDFTIAFWILMDGEQNVALFSKRQVCEAATMIEFRIFGHTVRMDFYYGPEQNVTLFSSSNVTSGGWHHIAMRRQGTAVDLFIDSVVEDWGSSPSVFDINNETPVQLGRSPCIGVDQTMPFDDLMDEVQLYLVALSDEEIALLSLVRKPRAWLISTTTTSSASAICCSCWRNGACAHRAASPTWTETALWASTIC